MGGVESMTNKQTFRGEIVREIRKRLSIQAIMVSFLLFIMLLVFLFSIQFYQLNKETTTIVSDFSNLKSDAFTMLDSLNESTVPNYLATGENERYLYQQFYEKASSFGDQSAYFVMNAKGKTLFQAGNHVEAFSSYFLKVVLMNNQKRHHFLKVVQGKNSQRYLLFFSRVPQSENYAIFVMNGSGFSPVGLQYGTQFVIADNFDNVYAKNTQSFVKGTIEKIESQIIAKQLFFFDGKLYLAKNVLLDANLSLYTFVQSFPLSVLLLFGLLSVVLVTILLLLQANHLAKAIGDKTTREIGLLVNETSKIRDGEKKRLSVQTNEEFQYLAESINMMVDRLDEMRLQQLTLEKQTTIFERKMLEAQFNPHFLYNTLENIRIMIQIDPPLADKLILSLNRVLRYSIDYKQAETTLESDLEIIDEFLKVNAVRFEKLRYQIHIASCLKQISVPRLFLLPLIENSLKYGMKKRSDLTITINCYCHGDQLIFSVEDNGPGFTKETIANLTKKKYKDQTHHGLENSLRRLRLFFPEAKLTIESVEEGSKVRFTAMGEKNV